MSTASAAESRQPVLPSELPLDDFRAEEPIPDEISHALSRRQLDVYVGDRRATAAELCAALVGSDDLDLPDGFSTALMATSAVNIADSEERHETPTDALPGYRPRWVDQVYRPRSLTLPVRRNLRTTNGAIVRPQQVALPSWMTSDEDVYGRDDRYAHRPAGYPWQCIGKLTIDHPGAVALSAGTAALVGRRTIITAAHIMPWRSWLDPQPPDNWSATFVAAQVQAGVSLLGPGAIANVTDAYGYFGQSVVANDMMIMRLDRPLGDLLGYLGVCTYEDYWEDVPMWTHIGYPASKGAQYGGAGQFPYRQEQIAVYDDDSGPDDSLELQHYGDGGPGDSGGPMFGWLRSFVFPSPTGGLEFGTPEPWIVGVRGGNWRFGGVLGFGATSHNVDAGGNALTRLCWYGRNHWD
jgi:hypothetical protein